jgi:Lrp/AsnC family transcriptional regulator, regulator for asnA, asnC and gidA
MLIRCFPVWEYGFLYSHLSKFYNKGLYNHLQYYFTMHFNTDLLDDVNLKIMDILGKDSSTPFVEIAKQIGISDATVHIRVRRLISERVINKFTISVDNNLLGYDHLAFIGINVEPGFADEAIYELSSLEEVLEVHEMHGTFDLLLKIRAKDLEQMRDVVENKIRKLPRILETELMTVLKTRKEEQIVSLKKDIVEKDTAVYKNSSGVS